MAAYVLTDWPVMQALARAADRGVVIRIVLDRSELPYEQSSRAFQMLAARAGVTIRVKRGDELAVDGRWLRTGSANLSVSGLQRQDNDLILVESPEAATAFGRKFESMFAAGETLAGVATHGQPKGFRGTGADLTLTLKTEA